MSVIAAVRKGNQSVVAADNLVTFGDKRVPADNLKVDKVRRHGSSLIAVAGWNVYDDILVDYLNRHPEFELDSRTSIFSFFMEFWKALHKDYTFVNDTVEGSDSPFGNLDSTFLIVNDAGIFLVTPDMGVVQFERYYAIGSGSHYCLGALEALFDGPLTAADLARRSCEIAVGYDVSCGEPVTVHALHPDPSPPSAAVG